MSLITVGTKQAVGYICVILKKIISFLPRKSVLLKNLTV